MTYKRRDVCLSLLTCAASMRVSFLAAATNSIGLLGEIIEKVGSVVKSISDGIEAMYKVGIFIVDDQRTREVQASLREVMSANNSLISSQASLLWLINRYTLKSDNWDQIRFRLFEVTVIVQASAKLLHNLAPQLPPELGAQISTLSQLYEARLDLITQIKTLPAPSTASDLSSLKMLGDRWNVLHEQLIHLNAALAEATKPNTTPR
jgi:hypothetical protein